MSLSELRQQLKLFPTVISLAGRDSLRREEALAQILSVFAPDPALRDFNVDTVTGPLTAAAKAALAEDPVSSDFRLIFLNSQEPDAFLKVKPQFTVLVAVGKPFAESQLEIDCARLFGPALKQWIRSEGRRAGLKLDKLDLEVLQSESDGSLRKLRGDIAKLALLGDSFGPDTVRTVAHSAFASSGWDILRAVLAGDLVKSVDALQRARAGGVALVQILAALQKEFRLLSLFLAGAPLTLTDFEKERLERLRVRFPKKAVEESLEDLLAAELRVKRGETSLLDLHLVTRLARRAA